MQAESEVKCWKLSFWGILGGLLGPRLGPQAEERSKKMPQEQSGPKAPRSGQKPPGAAKSAQSAQPKAPRGRQKRPKFRTAQSARSGPGKVQERPWSASEEIQNDFRESLREAQERPWSPTGTRPEGKRQEETRGDKTRGERTRSDKTSGRTRQQTDKRSFRIRDGRGHFTRRQLTLMHDGSTRGH